MEIDETLIVNHKFNRGWELKQLWLSGGIEKLGKRRFVVTLSGPTGDKRNSATPLPKIEKYIKPCSLIYSDAWSTYKSIGLLSFCYKYFVIIHTDNKEIFSRSQRMD